MKQANVLFLLILGATATLGAEAPAGAGGEGPDAAAESSRAVEALVASWQPGFSVPAGGARGMDSEAPAAGEIGTSRVPAMTMSFVCPATSQCAGAGAGCTIAGPCSVEDTNMQSCVGFSCPAGMTVHVSSCACSCNAAMCPAACSVTQEVSLFCA